MFSSLVFFLISFWFRLNCFRQCQRYYPAYKTFHLNNTINIDSIANHKHWDDLAILFSNLTKSEYVLEILSPSLQLGLQVRGWWPFFLLWDYTARFSKTKPFKKFIKYHIMTLTEWRPFHTLNVVGWVFAWGFGRYWAQSKSFLAIMMDIGHDLRGLICSVWQLL